MKKLSFILAMVLFSLGVSFGQSNIANVTESGIKQDAKITQTGILNKSYVDQSNEKNSVLVTQINNDADFNTLLNANQSGKRNEGTVYQNSYAGTGTVAAAIGTLEARLTQSGNDNDALQYQGPSNYKQGKAFAEIIQGGNDNFASQHQLNYGNEARINQIGSGNTAMQSQDAWLLPDLEASFNIASITQPGNDNTAKQQQDGHANLATAYQSGNGNLSTQTQKDFSWKSIADVIQYGSDNEATQTQLGNTNLAKIRQESNRNEATQTQTSDDKRTPGYAPLNNAEIVQWGDIKNVATQTQESLGLSMVVNEAIIWQDGSKNYATQIQTGGDNYSKIYQTGEGHIAEVTQDMGITVVSVP